MNWVFFKICFGIKKKKREKKIDYIYIEREMSSSYTQYNSKTVTLFIDGRFLRDPTVQKISLSILSLNIYYSPP